MKAICASVNLDLFMVLPRPTARIAHAAKLEFSSKDRSRKQGSRSSRRTVMARKPSLKRSSPSCGRSMFWSHKARTWWTQSVSGAKTAYIERGSPRENGYIESFNARLRDELLNGEIFYTLREAQIIIESWRRHYNTIRPHPSLRSHPPAPEVFAPTFAAWAGCATPTGSAGHAGETANLKLTSHLGHSAGAETRSPFDQ